MFQFKGNFDWREQVSPFGRPRIGAKLALMLTIQDIGRVLAFAMLGFFALKS